MTSRWPDRCRQATSIVMPSTMSAASTASDTVPTQ